MQLSSATFRSVLSVSIIITLLQSLAWIILTTLGILTFQCFLPMPDYGKDNIITASFVKFYFEGDQCKVNGILPGNIDLKKVRLTRPVVVNSWMVAYLTITILFFVLSAYVFYARSAEEEWMKGTLRKWCFLALIIISMDIIFTASFVIDYVRLSDYLETRSSDIQDIRSVPLAMFVVSARGFALWLFNLVQTIYFILWCTNASEREKRGREIHSRCSNYGNAYSNYSYSSSSETWNHLGNPKPGTKTYYPVATANRECRALSVESFEAVKAFNEELPPPVPAKKPDFPLAPNRSQKSDRNSTGYPCNCYEPKSNAGDRRGLKEEQWQSNTYHNHGCSLLRRELERKLAIRSEDVRLSEKPKTLTDFSHDIKNFQQGVGVRKVHKRATDLPNRLSPKVPSVPRVAICRDSDFD